MYNPITAKFRKHDPITGRRLIASDIAGNKAFLDPDGKIAVVNIHGLLVHHKDAEKFLNAKGIKTMFRDGKLFALK